MTPRNLTGGCARIDITPEIGTSLMGYPRPDRTAEGIGDSLQANRSMTEYTIGHVGPLLQIARALANDGSPSRPHIRTG